MLTAPINSLLVVLDLARCARLRRHRRQQPVHRGAGRDRPAEPRPPGRRDLRAGAPAGLRADRGQAGALGKLDPGRSRPPSARRTRRAAPAPGGDEAAGGATRSLVLVAMPEAMPACRAGGRRDRRGPDPDRAARAARSASARASPRRCRRPADAGRARRAAAARAGWCCSGRTDCREDAARTALTGASLAQLVYVSEADPSRRSRRAGPVVSDSFAGRGRPAPTGRRSSSACRPIPATARRATISIPRASGSRAIRTRSSPRPRSPPARRRCRRIPTSAASTTSSAAPSWRCATFDGARAEFARGARPRPHPRLRRARQPVASAGGGDRRQGRRGGARGGAGALPGRRRPRRPLRVSTRLASSCCATARPTPSARQGFDLLTRSLELGHTFAMNELGAYFIDPDSPHIGPGARAALPAGVGRPRRHLRLQQSRRSST